MSVNTAFETSDLPKAEFMFPGPERDRLVKLILDGVKTATAALMVAVWALAAGISGRSSTEQ